MSIINTKKFKACIHIFIFLHGISVQQMREYDVQITTLVTILKSPYVWTKVKTEAGRRTLWFQGSKIFNKLPTEPKTLNSQFLFKLTKLIKMLSRMLILCN